MRVAIYPGSFDPITNGHLDIITRGAKVFDKLIVGVLVNIDKVGLFSIKERVELIKRVTQHLPNVEVVSFNGLLVDLAKEYEAKVILKGLRAVTDFEYEFQMALMNSQLDNEVETLFMTTSAANSFLRSSSVKQVAKFGGKINGLVPDEIVESSSKMPITGKSMIDKKEFIEVIDKIAQCLPDQIKKAEWILNEKDRILGDAQKEYDSAKRESVEFFKQHVENHDIVREARLKASEIIALAERDAKAIRLGSREYSNEILVQLDQEIEKQKIELIKSMQESFEKVAKDIDENLTKRGTIIKENIAELRSM